MDRLQHALASSARRGSSGGAAVHRPRPLQDHQRHAGPRRRRPAAASRWPRACSCMRARGRHRGAPGRRRVRGDARRAERAAERWPPARPRPWRSKILAALNQPYRAGGQRSTTARPASALPCSARPAAQRGRAAQAGRPGHVPGQGGRAQHPAFLRPAACRPWWRRAPRWRATCAQALQRQAAAAALPAAGRPRRAASSAPRRCCAGSTRSAAWSCRPSSFPWPRDSGLILPLGQWVLQAACAQLVRLGVAAGHAAT